MGQRFSRVADIVITLSCVIVAGLFIEQRLSRTPAPPPDHARRLIGERVSEIAGVSFADAPRTLLIVMRSTCKFCDESGPFWRRLLESRRDGTGARLRVVAVSDEPTETSAEYLRRLGLEVDHIASARVPIRATPTLLLVDSQGVVKEAWIGKPMDKTMEDTIIKAVM